MPLCVPDEVADRGFLESAFDTLPSNVAVLDTDGTILSTNRSWQEFAAENGYQPRSDMVGSNYLDVADAADDPSATRAAAGIRAVLAGERERFELEYPCHSPDERRWFLLRAVGFAHEGDRYATVAHVDITDRREREEALERQRDELAQLQRLNTLVREITQALQDATTRDAVETAVCERLTESDLYRAVWIGRRGGSEPAEATVVPRTVAGVDESRLDGVPGGSGPAEAALRTGEVQVVDDVGTAEPFPTVRGEARSTDDPCALAAVPLTTGRTTYGVLVVYPPPNHAIGGSERDVLADLGRGIALAVQRVHSRRSLMAETAVRLDLRVPDADIGFAEISAALDCELVLERRVPTAEGRNIYYLTVRGADPEAVRERLEAGPQVDSVSMVRDGGGVQPPLFEMRLRDTPRLPCEILTDYGASVTATRVVDGDISIRVELPPGVDLRAVLDALREVAPALEVVSKQHIDRPTETITALRERITDRLTPKQTAALEAAYARGYYTWPRDSTVEELTETFDVSAPTLHYRLRKAHQTVISALLDGEDTYRYTD